MQRSSRARADGARSRWRAVAAGLLVTAASASAVVAATATPAGAVTPGSFAVVDVPGSDDMTAGYYRTSTGISATGSSAGIAATVVVPATAYNSAQTFTLELTPRTGGSLAAPLTEVGTGPTAAADQAGLVVRNGAATCVKPVGQFTINDLAFGGGGTVTRMAMTWRLKCESSPNNTVSSGYVYLNEPAGPLPGGPTPGEFYPITPKRVLDTRSGLGSLGPIGPGGTANVQVRGGSTTVPANAIAVVANVTATGPTSTTYLTVYPAGAGRPEASNVNPVAGDTVPNLATVKVGTDNSVTVYNSVGFTHAVMDITGYFLADDGNAAVGGRFRGQTPTRVLDTRTGGGPVGPGGTRTITVDAGATAAVLNVTATDGTGPSYLTAYPANENVPLASNLNFWQGQTIANLVVVKLSGGQAKIYNSSGSVHVVVDVVGTFKAATGPGDASGRFVPQDPTRVYDSRNPAIPGLPNTPIGPGEQYKRDLGLIGINGKYPFEYGGVIANLTVTNTTAASYLTAYPAGTVAPLASNLNWRAGETRPNLVMMGTDDYGVNSFYNSAGDTHLVIDVAGWFTR